MIQKGRLPHTRQAACEVPNQPIPAVVPQFGSLSYMGMPKDSASSDQSCTVKDLDIRI